MRAPFSQRLTRALLRAGAGGARHASIGGRPELGLAVPVQTAQELRRALEILAEQGVRATLPVPPALALTHPEVLQAAARAGHELVGRGTPQDISVLEVAAGQPVRGWWAESLRQCDLSTLAAQQVFPLPLPAPVPEPGQVLALHPAQLEAQVPPLVRQGYRPGPVGALSTLRPATPRDLLFHLYTRLVEDRFTAQAGVIGLLDRPDALLRVAPLDHAPRPLPLSAGTPTAELHLHSGRLVGLAAVNQRATYRATLRSLHDVAAALEHHPQLRSAQAVFAVSLLGSGLESVGFAALDLPPWQARWYGLGFRLLRLAYGTARPPHRHLPRLVWMPRDDFLRRFGDRG